MIYYSKRKVRIVSKSTKSTPAISDVAQRAKAISALRVKGDRYGSAGIAGLAHELALNLNGDKLPAGVAKSLVESTGYDKGTVSRVSKIIRDNASVSVASFFKGDAAVSVAEAKALFGTTTVRPRAWALKLDVLAIDANATNLSAAVIVGKLFKRQASKSTASNKATEKEDADPLADIYQWLIESTDEQYEGRKAAVADILARIDDERAAIAAAAAEADSEEIAA